MSEPEKRKKRMPLKSPNPEKMQPKLLLIWLGIIVIIASLWMYRGPQEGGPPKEVRMNDVLTAAQEGRVIEGARIKFDPTGGPDWAVVDGKMMPRPGAPVPVKEGEVEAPPVVIEPFRFIAEGNLTPDSFDRLRNTGLFKEVRAGSVWQSYFLPFLPFVLLIALVYFLFVRQIRQAGRGALNFGKSRAKMLQRDRDRVTFADVAGCDEAKEEVQEIIEFLKDPKKFQKVGGRIPKGILMVGPPGTGKTLLAKAIAGEADVPFFSISGSDFVEMFVGVGASRVRDMFEQGRKNAPCLLFIDEIDAVGRQRGAGLGGGNDEREQTLNSLLVEMDGFDTTEGLIIIAATNRPDVLDQALLRPGRFDRQVYVDLPDIIGREQILRVHARKIPLSEDVDLGVLARGTPGLSGADLANLLNESALLAARRNKKKVEMIDVEDAREKVLFGRERRRVMDDKEKLGTAWHEAGHAVVQAVLDDGTVPVHKVTIIPRGRSLGSTSYIPTKDILLRSQTMMLNQVAMAMGGRIAEKMFTNDISTGASGDIKQATAMVRAMVCDYGMSPLGPISYGENEDTVFLGREITRSRHVSEETARRIDAEVSRIISEQYTRAEEILHARKEALEKIATALLEHETLDGKHIMEILEHGEIRSPVTKVDLGKPETVRERKAKEEQLKKGKELTPPGQPTGAPA
jgi:cell division protease FtsH